MTRAEVIDSVAKKTGLNKRQAGDALSAVLTTISETLKKGGSVAFIGFGTFAVVARKARTGLNPQTGEKLKIPARKVPKFKPGADLKKAVSRSK